MRSKFLDSAQWSSIDTHYNPHVSLEGESFLLWQLKRFISDMLYLLEYKMKIFFLIHHLKNGGSSYNRAQSSKNRVNVFVISNTMKICLHWVVQLFCCVIFFFLFYHIPCDLIYGNIRE
jgi:hypothetical protein